MIIKKHLWSTFKVFMYMQLQDLAHELQMGLESLQTILMEEKKRSQKEEQNLQCLQVESTFL